jgi:ribonuclease R
MREKRGAIDFDVDEGKVIVDEKGTPIEIKLMIRGESEKVIEEFMLKANETVASTINHLELPFIYRIHDTPNVIKLNNFKDLSRSLGYQTWKKKVNSKQLQVFLEQVKEEDNYLKTFLLRSMAKAIYSESNIGHYGLGSSCYTHFTSPIRRYPDLIVHRLLRKYLFDKNINSDEFLGLTARIADIAEQSSKKERDAIDCEYQVDDMKKAEYMNSFIGEKYEGIISSVTKFGFFVSLPNTVDGLVHVSNLPGRFNFDPKTMALYGPGTKKYKLGDKVEIEVATADKKSRKIDFKVISKNEEKTVDAVKYSGNESALPTRNRGGKVSRYGESKRRRKK